eukprot:gene5392-135_t
MIVKSQVFEAYDVKNGLAMRSGRAEWNGGPAGPGQYFTEWIHDSNQQKAWTIQLDEQKHEVNCVVAPFTRNVTAYCLETNATMHDRAHLVAGSTVTETWEQQYYYTHKHPWDSGMPNSMVTEYHHITAGTDIPFTRNRIFHYPGYVATEHVTFFDVTEHVTPAVFVPPSFCPKN